MRGCEQMSDLTEFRDHAQRLSTADHRDDCDRIHRIVKLDRWLNRYGLDATLSCGSTDGHEPHFWQVSGLDWDCPGLCGGCMPDSERALWTKLASEVDAYLNEDRVPDDDLFGGVA